MSGDTLGSSTQQSVGAGTTESEPPSGGIRPVSADIMAVDASASAVYSAALGAVLLAAAVAGKPALDPSQEQGGSLPGVQRVGGSHPQGRYSGPVGCAHGDSYKYGITVGRSAGVAAGHSLRV